MTTAPPRQGLEYQNPFSTSLPSPAPLGGNITLAKQALVVQQRPYEALDKAPRDLKTAASIAMLSGSASRVIGILSSTTIFALLPTWVPGILALQPLPVGLLVLTLGSFILSRSSFQNRERIAARQFEKARSSSLTGTILGLTIGGIVPGILNFLLYMRIGSIMVKRRPDDPGTIYLLPFPSEGMFLGRYLGWLTGYFLVLFLGYAQLPQGLASINGWLSPVFGVHFNTLIVAAYLTLGNPLTYPPLLQLWATVGFLGGIIAGGRVGRGFWVGLSVFLSTLGAMGLASLAIFQGFSLATFASVPSPPPGFSLGSVATGPVSSDLIPIFLGATSLTDQAFMQNLALSLLRNTLLVVAVVTISGRAGCLLWQGGVFLLRQVTKTVRRKPSESETSRVATGAATVRVGVLLFLVLLGALIPLPEAAVSTATFHAPPPPAGPYNQNLAVGLNMLGAPNASLRLANLDLSPKGLVIDNNYDNNNFSAFIVNNNYPQAFGPGPQSGLLRLFSEPTLLVQFTDSLSSSTTKGNVIAAQFSQALGTSLTLALALPLGAITVLIYSPTSALSNSDALRRVLTVLPPNSFSNLVNATNVDGERYFAMLGILPSFSLPGLNMTLGGGFSFMLNVQFPRQFYKEGPHQFSLKTLIGFQSNISPDPAANVSLVTLTFPRVTTLYSTLGPNPYYDNSTSTYYLYVNGTTGPATDLNADFAFPFAPNIMLQKTVNAVVGSVGSTRTVTLTLQNLDIVAVENLTVTDPQASSSYRTTLQLTPSGTQTLQEAVFAANDTRTLIYTSTPMSSGTYVLSPATAEFLWLASNGTSIRYAMSTEEPPLTSTSGPATQFGNTINDLWPYSALLLLSLVSAPLIEVARRLGRRKRPKYRFPRERPAPPSAATPPDESSRPQ